MDKERLRRIIQEITHVNQKGKDTPRLPEVFERVDMYICTVDVRLHLAQRHKDELEIFIRGRRKKFFSGLEPDSFGRAIGDETLAIRFMAIGKVLGFWDLVIPKDNQNNLLCMTNLQL
jgi:hypothetical protein